tara:strand:+ start:399 stop:827 length:429 start_codon:yes stop_codon:yes gene_type:complete
VTIFSLCRRTLFLLLFAVSWGCVEQEYSQCPAPDDDLKILFKKKMSAHPSSHSFCIVCNVALESSAIAGWAIEMGASDVGDEPETPCLYAYANADMHPDGYSTLAQCQAGVCGGTATHSDIVSRRNGNIDLEPILGPVEGTD